MWQQFLRVPGLRFVSGSHPTVAHFPSTHRTSWSIEERLEELARWATAMEEPGFRERWYGQVLELVSRTSARLEEQVDRFRRHAEGLERHAAELEGHLERVKLHVQRLEQERQTG